VGRTSRLTLSRQCLRLQPLGECLISLLPPRRNWFLPTERTALKLSWHQWIVQLLRQSLRQFGGRRNRSRRYIDGHPSVLVSSECSPTGTGWVLPRNRKSEYRFQAPRST